MELKIVIISSERALWTFWQNGASCIIRLDNLHCLLSLDLDILKCKPGALKVIYVSLFKDASRTLECWLTSGVCCLKYNQENVSSISFLTELDRWEGSDTHPLLHLCCSIYNRFYLYTKVCGLYSYCFTGLTPRKYPQLCRWIIK